MDELAPEDLYEERGDVSLARPILQGDVFQNVQLPGFGDAFRIVQVVTHPCSMRRGSELNERTQVVPVEHYPRVTDWNQHGKVMPLPELREDGTHYAAKFVDLTAMATVDLKIQDRIASLSHGGIHVLQQRIVKHYTRVEIGLDDFREQSSTVLAEAEMQESWVDILHPEEDRTVEEVFEASRLFQSWLDEEGSKRRRELELEANHARLRKEARAAALANRNGH